MYKDNAPIEACMFVGGDLMREFVAAGKTEFNREAYTKTPSRGIDISNGYTSKTIPGEKGLAF